MSRRHRGAEQGPGGRASAPRGRRLLLALLVASAGAGCDSGTDRGAEGAPQGAGGGGASSASETPPLDVTVFDGLVPAPIEVAANLRLGRTFDYELYFGTFLSREELDWVWGYLENVEAEGNPLTRGEVPDPPEIDFENEMLLWFADRGASASFVSAIALDALPPETLRVRVTAFHSDFGSRRINLWRVPRYEGPVEFEIEHEYEDGI